MAERYDISGYVKPRLTGPPSKRWGSKVITIPSRLAQHLTGEEMFDPELTEDGILFRYVGQRGKSKNQSQRLPGWTKETGRTSDSD